jgi:NAD(P)-dependent dehydrogenase (short-subunit alcohol dehydrogenase family)
MAIGIDQAIKASDVLLAGASSQIGIFAIPRLLRAGFRVLAVSRTGRPQLYPVIEQLEWLSEADAV